MNIALFLGAGASVPYGMPTTVALWRKIVGGKTNFPRKDLLKNDEFSDIEHVLDALDELIAFAQSRAGRLYAQHSKKTSKDYSSRMADPGAPATDSLRAHIVDPALLPFLHEGGRRAVNLQYAHIADPTLPQKLRVTPVKSGPSVSTFNGYAAASRSAKKIIENTITREYRWDPSRTQIAEKILGPLFELAKSRVGHVTVFTTNYDVAVERYCENSGSRLKCIDGFRNDEARRITVWDDKFSVDDDNHRRHINVLLYKLHGSTNWLASNADVPGTIVQKPDGSESDDRASDMYIRPSLDVKDEATHKEPYTTILGRFTKTLPLFDACVVIGYSFRDPHISDKLVEFATSGGLLIAVSPTAAADFWKNALREEPPTDTKAEQERTGQRGVKFTSGDKQGLFYPIHKKIDQDGIGRVVDEIRSILRGAPRSRQAAPAAEAADA